MSAKKMAKTPDTLLHDLRSMIEETRSTVATTVNAALTMLYWRVGLRIQREIVKGERAEYGKAILPTLSAKLSWSHFKAIVYLDDPLKRDFYAEMCRIEGWNTRTLQKKIDSMLFERTALSKKPDELIRRELYALRHEDLLTPELVFRDPYFLDFLGLNDRYLEKDMEVVQ